MTLPCALGKLVCLFACWFVCLFVCPHLLVAEAGDLVHVLLLDHEGGQVGSVAGQEDDGEEGPHRHHDLTGGALGVLHRHGVVEDQAPQQPDGLADGEGGTAGL